MNIGDQYILNGYNIVAPGTGMGVDVKVGKHGYQSSSGVRVSNCPTTGQWSLTFFACSLGSDA